MVIFSKHNQKYHCTLPRPLPAVEQEEEDTSPSLHGVSELLEPLKKSCFTKVSTNAWLNGLSTRCVCMPVCECVHVCLCVYPVCEPIPYVRLSDGGPMNTVTDVTYNNITWKVSVSATLPMLYTPYCQS